MTWALAAVARFTAETIRTGAVRVFCSLRLCRGGIWVKERGNLGRQRRRVAQEVMQARRCRGLQGHQALDFVQQILRGPLVEFGALR